MRRRPAGFLLLVLAAVAKADDVSTLPPGTLRIYAAFIAGYHEPNASDPKLMSDLAAAPDGDLCLLDAALRNGGWSSVMAGHELARLHTPRTLDRLIAIAADGGDTRRSTRAVVLLGEIGDGRSVAVLLDALATGDPDRRDAVVGVLPQFHDPRVEAALLRASEKNDFVAEHALSSLATLKSAAVFGRVVAGFRRTDLEGFYKMQAIVDVAAYGNAAAADLLVGRMRELDGKADDDSNELRRLTADRLADLFRPAETALAPTLGELPDPFADEWTVYWSAARPLLTDDLRPKRPPTTRPSPRVFAPADFAATADRVTFSVGVNAKVYRIGDPIRVDLRLTNVGPAPVSTIPPVPRECWSQTMAYGIKLTRGGETLFDLQPSDAYMGSFAGPPDFVTLAPGGSAGSSVCLQRWLERVATPLPRGEYELSVVYDSAKYAGLTATVNGRTHRWTAPPVRFTIDGPALTRPADVMANLVALSGRRFFEHDLRSENAARGEAAWEALSEYGDTRLSTIDTGTIGLRPFDRPASP